MANEFTSPFDDSPLNHFDALKTGTHFDFAFVDGSPYIENGYVTSVNQQTLIRFLITAHKAGTKPKFYWGNFKGPQNTVIVKDEKGFDGGEEFEATVRSDKKASLDGVLLKSMSAMMSARNGIRIDPYPGFRISIDTRKKRAAYRIYFLYKEGTVLLEDDIKVEISQKDQIGKTSPKQRGIAVRFDTNSPFGFYLVYKAFGIDIDKSLFRAFDIARGKLPKGDVERKNNFYFQAPLKYLVTLKQEDLYTDFIDLLQYDVDKWFIDNSNTMIKALGALVGKKEGKGMEYLYTKLNDDPDLIKKIYSYLDGSQKSAYYEEKEIPNQSIFAVILLIICNHNGQGKNNKRFKPTVTYIRQNELCKN